MLAKATTGMLLGGEPLNGLSGWNFVSSRERIEQAKADLGRKNQLAAMTTRCISHFGRRSSLPQPST